MGAIPQPFIQSVIDRIDIIEIVKTRVDLKKNGMRYKGLCPFHNEKSPSFTVNAERQFFYCFGCGARGDVIEFVRQYDHLDFIDALGQLAGQLGLEIPKSDNDDGQPRESKEPYYQVLAECSQYYQQLLKQQPAAIDYLKSRGLSGAIAKQYGVGFSIDSWDALSKHIGKDKLDTLLQAGMLIEKDGGRRYDRFRGRVMFPIRDTRGRVIGFGARGLNKDQQPKYLNSPETPVFHKNRALYGLYEALQANRTLEQVIIVEGYMDVIALAQHDITIAVATLGTATNPKHLQLLLRYTQSMVFCFDGDRAGREAAWSALKVNLPVLRDGISLRFVLLPEGEDPDSLVRSIGKQGFEQLLSQGKEAADFMFEHLDENIPRHSLADIARYAKAADELIRTLPAGLYHTLLEKQLAQHLNIEPNELSDLVHSKQPAASPAPAAEPELAISNQDLTQHMSTIRLANALLLQQPSLVTEVPDTLQQLPAEQPEYKIFKYIIKQLTQNPQMTTSNLIEQCESNKLQHYLAALTAWQPSFPAEGIKAEFEGILNKLIKINIKQQADQLIQLAKQRPLDQNEKQQLQTLLRQAATEQPST
ncbi:MAG: DNA primase [Coxiellaceae bacterium]|nr:DNA primase [Coxiellaceae bacterium]